MNLKEQRNKKILRGLSKNAFFTWCIANSMRVFIEISISIAVSNCFTRSKYFADNW